MLLKTCIIYNIHISFFVTLSTVLVSSSLCSSLCLPFSLSLLFSLSLSSLLHTSHTSEHALCVSACLPLAHVYQVSLNYRSGTMPSYRQEFALQGGKYRLLNSHCKSCSLFNRIRQQDLLSLSFSGLIKNKNNTRKYAKSNTNTIQIHQPN